MAPLGQCTQAMLAKVADGTRHPDTANTTRTPLPGLKSAAHNIYTSSGDFWARKETIDGRPCIHCHIGAGAIRSSAGDARCELELNMPNFTTSNDPIYYGYTIWTTFNPSASQSLPRVNIHFQLKGPTGGPAVSVQSMDGENGRGIYVTENNSNERYNMGLSQADLLVPHRLVMGFENITIGRGTGSRLRGWMDGKQIFDDTDWRSDDGAGHLGGLLFSNATSAYNKFGIYGSGGYGIARDYYFTDIIASNVLSDVGFTVSGGTTPPPGEPTPKTPTGLHVVRVGDGLVHTDWADNTDLRIGDYYEIEVL